jgi:hypothetical protein
MPEAAVDEGCNFPTREHYVRAHSNVVDPKKMILPESQSSAVQG